MIEKCAISSDSGFLYYSDYLSPADDPLWPCVEEAVSAAEETIQRPQLTADDFRLPLIKFGYETTPHPHPLPHGERGNMNPPSLDSLSTLISIQTDDPLVFHLELPYWFDYRIQVDLGRLQLPVNIREDSLLLNDGTFIESKGGRLIFSLDRDSEWVQKANYEIPIRGIKIENGHPVLQFDGPDVHTSWFPEFIDSIFSRGLQKGVGLLQKGVDFFWGDQYPSFERGIDSDYVLNLGPKLHQIPALEKLTDEKGAFREKIPLDEIRQLIPDLRDSYNREKLVQPEEKGKEKKRDTGAKIARFLAEHVRFDSEVHSYARASDIDTEFRVQSGEREADVTIDNAQIFFDWNAPTNYELRGTVPITEINIEEENGTSTKFSGKIDFHFNTETKKLFAEAVFNAEGIELADEVKALVEINLPNWEADSTDFKAMVNDISARVIVEAFGDGGILTRAVAGIRPGEKGVTVEFTGGHWNPPRHLEAGALGFLADIPLSLDSLDAAPFAFKARMKSGSVQGTADDLVARYHDGAASADLQVADSLLSVQTGGKRYAFTFAGNLSAVDNLTDKSTPIDTLNLNGRFAAYDGKPETKALIALIEQTQAQVRLEEVDWNRAKSRPDQLTGKLKVDLSGIKADRYLSSLTPENQRLVQTWLKKEPVEFELGLNWKPREPSIPQPSPLDLDDGINPESLGDAFDVSEDSPSDSSGGSSNEVTGLGDLVQPLLQTILSVQEGLITTTKDNLAPDQYNRDYWKKWEGKSPLSTDLARNRWVKRQQRRMRKKDGGFLLFEGKGGIYRTKSGKLDYRYKKNTRADFWVVTGKDQPADDFGRFRGIDILFSKTVCVRVFHFLPVMGLNGLYVDLEEGEVVADLCPWPDCLFSGLVTKKVWKVTPDELKALLKKNGFDERYPADLEVWFKVLSELDLEAVVKKAIAEKKESSSETEGSEETSPASKKKNNLSDMPFIAKGDMEPIHIDIQLAPHEERDFGFVKFRFECLDDSDPNHPSHSDPNFNRLIADIDPVKKTIKLDFPKVERLVIESDDQQLILEDGFANGLEFSMKGESSQPAKEFTMSAEKLGVKSVQFFDLSEEGPSYDLHSVQQNTFSNLSGSLKADGEGKWSLGIGLDFDPSDKLEIDVFDREKDETKGVNRINKHYVLLDNARGVTGHLNSSMNIQRGEAKDIDLEQWGIDLDIPQATVTLGMAEERKRSVRQLAAQSHPAKLAEGLREKGFEVTFNFTGGDAKIGYQKKGDQPADSRPDARFTGKVKIDTDTPFSTEQPLGPGVMARLQSKKIGADFFGLLLLRGDLLSVKPLPTADNAPPEPIRLSLTGSGELIVDSSAMKNDKGESKLPAMAPDFKWIGQFDDASVDAVVDELEIILASNLKVPGDIKPQLKALNLVDGTVTIHQGKSDMIVTEGNLELARNIWNDIGGSTLHVSHFDATLITDKDLFARGLFDLNLHDRQSGSDRASKNRINARLDFSPGKKSDPLVDIYLEDPYGANQLAFTFGGD